MTRAGTPAPALPDGGPRSTVVADGAPLVVLRAVGHATYARFAGHRAGRVVVATLAAELLFDADTGRLVAPQRFRPRWTLDTSTAPPPFRLGGPR